MNPVTFNLILKSNTQSGKNFFGMIITFLVAGLLIPFLIPIPFFIVAGIEIVRELIRFWRTLRWAADEAASLTVTLRGIFPGVPDVTPTRLRSLVRTGRLTIDGEDGSRLHLILSDQARLKRLRDGYTVRAAFRPANFGLAQFDKIMGDLTHSSPVATAIERIRAEEQNQSVLSAGVPFPNKPDLRITEKRSSWMHSSDKAADAKRKTNPTSK